MTAIDARNVPADPQSHDRLRDAGYDYRVVDLSVDAEATALSRATARGFLGSEPSDAELVRMRESAATRRNLGVYEPGAEAETLPVATINSWVAPMTAPGGEIPMWAISAVTVSAMHRRRGIARNLLEGELRAAASAGVPLAGLTVSEATIYSRYGFGPAVPAARVEIDTSRIGWAGAEAPGRLEYLEREQLVDELGAVHERARSRRTGQIPGWRGRWLQMAGLGDESKKDAAVRGVRYLDAAGETRGAIAYTLEDLPDAFRSTLRIRHLAAETDEALRALWRFAVTHDLVDRVEADLRPVDDPIVHLVADQRAVRFTVHDHGWLRVLDVPAALQARRYAASADVVMQVDDALGFARGTWRVRIGADDAAEVTDSDADPDVMLGVVELSTAYAGAVPLGQLAAAGRVHGDEAAIAALGRALRVDPSPALGIWY